MPETSVRLEQLLPLMQERLATGDTVQFTPRGISMRPLIEGGRDQVILAALPNQLKKYDLPLYRRDDGQFVLHRIVKVGRTYTCIGDHQLVYEEGVRREWMIALATGFIRKGKYYSADSVGYKVYCRLWHWTRPIRRIGYILCNIWRAVIRRLKKIFA